MGPAVVELSFDDDTLRYVGAVAPPCVRIHAAQALKVTNEAHFTSYVSIGAATETLPAGHSLTTGVMSKVA